MFMGSLDSLPLLRKGRSRKNRSVIMTTEILNFIHLVSMANMSMITYMQVMES